mgnify:CR=1 FL=1
MNVPFCITSCFFSWVLDPFILPQRECMHSLPLSQRLLWCFLWAFSSPIRLILNYILRIYRSHLSPWDLFHSSFSPCLSRTLMGFPSLSSGKERVFAKKSVEALFLLLSKDFNPYFSLFLEDSCQREWKDYKVLQGLYKMRFSLYSSYYQTTTKRYKFQENSFHLSNE